MLVRSSTHCLGADFLDTVDDNIRTINHDAVAAAARDNSAAARRESLQLFLQRIPDRPGRYRLSAPRISWILRNDEQRQIVAAASAGGFLRRIPELVSFSAPTRCIRGAAPLSTNKIGIGFKYLLLLAEDQDSMTRLN